MVFSTNSDLFYTYLQYKREKSHGLFGLGWKNQEQTVNTNTVKIVETFIRKLCFLGLLSWRSNSPLYFVLLMFWWCTKLSSLHCYLHATYSMLNQTPTYTFSVSRKSVFDKGYDLHSSKTHFGSQNRSTHWRALLRVLLHSRLEQ